ncbi:MAG: DUF6603 domain-containing protein, partial [Crocinitomicaceae bacterium]
DGPATNEQRTSIIGNINTLMEALEETGIPDLPERIFNDLVYKYLKRYQTKLFAILHIFGIIQKNDENLAEIRWDRLGKVFYAPGEIMEDPDLYNWGGKFNSSEFFQRMSVLFGAFSLPGGVYPRKESVELSAGDLGPEDFRIPIFMSGTHGEDNYSEITLNLAELIEDEDLSGIFLYPRISGGASIAFDISESWELVLSAGADLENGIGFSLMPPLELDFVKDLFDRPLDFIDFELKLTLQRKTGADIDPMIIFGDEESSSMTVSDVTIPLFAGLKDGTFDLGAEMNIENIILSIKGGDADGFIGALIPEEGINNTFGLGLGYSVKRGFYLTDSTSLEFSFPANIPIGPIVIEEFGFYIDPSAEGVEIGGTTRILANIGPLVARIEEMGLKFNFPFPAEGEKGIPTPTIGFKPPAGIGLSIKTPVVSGGGYLYFDYEKGEYSGVGEVTIDGVITVSAIAIITTKPPAGATEPGFSLLLIIAASQLPTIQLGFGFTLNGIGGLFAANRTMDLDALRAGVSNGTIDNLLFPDDPVKNAPQIIDQMGAIFPIEAGAFTFGVMAKLGWGTPTLISLELGLIVSAPSFSAAIVGVLKAILPAEDLPILSLVVSFVGTVDPENQMITFDASLEGSQLLGAKLYGEMAFRLRWGNDPMFLLSVGGFHPEFTPPEINLPSTFRRITLEILPKNPKLTLTGYFAITPNTLQFGAGVDLYIKKGKFNITGFCKFNTLIQFNPFYLKISLDAGLSVKWGKMELLGVSFGGSLSGPGPWVASGYAEFKVVIKIKVNVNVTFGDRLETNQPTIKVLDLIMTELGINENYEVLFPSESKMLATSKYEEGTEEASEEEKLLLHPAGKLSFKQLKVPLNVDLEKIGTRFVKGDKNFSLTMSNSDDKDFETTDIQENFAPGEFFDLSLNQKLSRPSFEKYDGGITMSEEAFDFSDDLEMELEYEERLLDVEEDTKSGGLKDRSIIEGVATINKHFFDLARTVNTVHSHNTVLSNTVASTIAENAVSTVTPELSLAYDGTSTEGIFSNFNEVYTFKNELLFTGEFDYQEVIPQYELFD